MSHCVVDLVKLDRLDCLIRRKATGSPIDLAKRMGVSRSHLFRMLSFLRLQMKAPINYDRYISSYYYSYSPKFYLGFERDRFNETSMENISGGNEDDQKFNKTQNNEKPDDELELNKKGVL